MKKAIEYLVGSLCVVFLMGHFMPLRDAPLFLSMEEEYGKVYQSKKMLSFPSKDTLVEHQLELLQDEGGEPLLFFSRINTPVCIDNICKPMDIKIYWNLVGEYVGYDTLGRFPLTKFDHDLFEGVDYEKLHRLLLDKHSILERKEMSDLFDPNSQPEKQVTYQGVEVDAATGATKKEIKESVVEGALYSCYTIWHLVHGSVVDSMKQVLEDMASPSLMNRFLYSSHEDYQFYAVREMNEEMFIEEAPRLSAIFISSKPLIRTYILKKMPDNMWGEESVTSSFFETFSNIDINSRTLLIKGLNKAHKTSSQILLKEVKNMSRNQLKLYLAFFEDHENTITPEVLSRFEAVVETGNYTYAYMLEEFLETYNP